MIHKESETTHYAIDPKTGLKIDPKTGKKLDPKIVLKPKPADTAVSVIYWEKQEAAFCAVHAINNLLQGNYFNEWDLSQIAQRLHDDERKLMAEMGTETNDFLQFMAKDSQHVDDSGNFSIEVIKKALEKIGMQCHSITSEHGKAGGKDPLTENAFICNLNDHWYVCMSVCLSVCLSVRTHRSFVRMRYDVCANAAIAAVANCYGRWWLWL
jgi:hypothetical protein